MRQKEANYTENKEKSEPFGSDLMVDDTRLEFFERLGNTEKSEKNRGEWSRLTTKIVEFDGSETTHMEPAYGKKYGKKYGNPRGGISQRKNDENGCCPHQET